MEKGHELVTWGVGFVHNICGFEVKVASIPRDSLGIVVRHVPKVAEFVDLGWATNQAVEDAFKILAEDCPVL